MNAVVIVIYVVVTIVLYVVTFFVALWVGGLVGGVLGLPIAVMTKIPSALSFFQAATTAAIGILMFRWLGRDPTTLLIVLVVSMLWNDKNRWAMQAARTPDAQSASLAEVQVQHAFGDVLGVVAMWMLMR